ncbi:SNF2 family N-terminal domain-containing protein [Scheffersomyces coipomensis]|uniref:SNF2 family N-terminal domain-containing protein n=1 Tax=Scheffersomyces coipomensis TaxID=1788519 RepID=UPI00315D11C9
MTLSLIHFEFDNISNLAKLGQVTPEKAKKKPKTSVNSSLSIDNLKYTEYYKSAGINNVIPSRLPDDEYVTLVNRCFKFHDESPINLADKDFSNMLESGNGIFELVTDNIKLSIVSGNLLYVKSTNKFDSSKLLLSIGNSDLSDIPSLKQELSILNFQSSKLDKNKLTVSKPTIKLEFNLIINKIGISLTYSVQYACGIGFPHQVDKISNILSSRVDYFPTSNESSAVTSMLDSEPVSARLFYTSISENTDLMPKIEDEFDIPELETNLIRFQKRSVNWLLSKENVKFNFDTSRCSPLPFIDEESQALLSNNDNPSDTLDCKLYSLLNKLCFGWKRIKLDGKIYFFNRLTAHIISRTGACRYLMEHKNQLLPAQSLLSEEMGLGKTVEMTALMLMNKRSIDEVNDTIEHQINQFGDVKTLVKAKTTLVIAPDSILKQWVEEIVHLAPSLAVTVYTGVGKYPKLDNNPALIAEYLRKFDVVFTTYAVIARELDYALYSSRPKHTRNAKSQRSYNLDDDENEPSSSSHEANESALLDDYKSMFQLTLTSIKPKIANERTGESQAETDYEKALQDEIGLAISHNKIPSIYKKVEYESPLMLSQFWRVILDEVQMVSSTVSRAFQSAALIPRFHAWGVSGTPIKKNLEDLHSILHFLKYQPFCGDIGKWAWELITKNSSNSDFIKLWTTISLRHTKSMVHDDIKLPPQSRILLTIPFTPVEQDFYNQKFEECLAAICLDVNGNPISNDWEPSTTIMNYMRSWLVRLRQICCNSQIGRLNIGSKRYKRNNTYMFSAIQQLKTLENLLDDMLTKAYTDIMENEKQLIQLYLEVGEFFEFCYLPERALPYLTIGVEQTERIIFRCRLILNKYIKEFKDYRRRLDSRIDDEIDNDDTIGSIDGKNETQAMNDEVLEKLEDKIAGFRLRIRTWNTTLHRFYFLIASSYFQRYDKDYNEVIKVFKLPETSIRFDLLQKFEHYEETERSNEIASLINGVDLATDFEVSNYSKDFVLDPSWTDDQSKEEEAKFLESKFYELAEETRGILLKGTIANVNSVVESRIKSRGRYLDLDQAFIDAGEILLPKNSKKFFFAVPVIDVGVFTDHSIYMKVKVFSDKLFKMIEELNSQALILNSWVKHLIEILCTPVLTQDKSPAGTEYEETIQDQDKVSSYLFVLSQTLIDRGESINGSENSAKIVTIRKAQEKKDTDFELQKINDQEFLVQLQSVRNTIKPKGKSSLQELVLSIKNLETEIKEDELLDQSRSETQLKLLEDLGKKLRIVFDNQKLALVLLQKELTVNCNAVFNSRVDYYKQLQQISDTVQTSDFGMDRSALAAVSVNRHLSQKQYSYDSIKLHMDKSVAKFRYLRGLVGVAEGNLRDDEEGMMCIICRSTITIGSLTQCGHKYCKECLEQWIRNSHTCPMCKRSIHLDSVYNFTHHKPNLKANKVVDSLEGGSHSKNLYSIYKALPKDTIEEIQNVKLENSYSSKVNMIVKQVLYLRSQNPSVQIVVYSQWQDMLYILGTAFKDADITYLGSYGTLRPDTGVGRKMKMFDSVETFKNPDNNITCFLLNAKAQASGLTLINASHIFLCEPLVNTSLELQAISRIHRIGQTKPTTVWMFAIENTVEESIVVMSTNKRLQYMEMTPEVQSGKTKAGNDANIPIPNSTASLIAISDEKSLSKAESLTLMNSGGNDTLVGKGKAQGESVTNFDLWAAFFSARAGSGIVRESLQENSDKLN